ncbi:unnamed protein product [Discosporangium mesarthrocarpum]
MGDHTFLAEDRSLPLARWKWGLQYLDYCPLHEDVPQLSSSPSTLTAGQSVLCTGQQQAHPCWRKEGKDRASAA